MIKTSNSNRSVQEKYNSPFATRLRLLMDNEDKKSPLMRKVTQQELSKIIGVSRQAISQYRNGSTLPTIDKLVLISNFFNVSSDYLLGKAECQKVANEEIQKSTGLSDDVIFLLKHWKNEQNNCIDFINEIIPKIHFSLNNLLH